MGCNDIYELLSAYVDDCVSSDERVLVENHLAECPNCRKELDEIKNVISQIQFSNPQLDVPENFMNDLRSRIDKETKPASKVIRFNASSVFKYSGIAACVSLALLSGTFFNNYYVNKDKYINDTPPVIAVDPTKTPSVATNEPAVVTPEITAEPVSVPVESKNTVTAAPETSKPIVNANKTVNKPVPTPAPVIKDETAGAAEEVVIPTGKKIEVVEHQESGLTNQSILTTIDTSDTDAVIKSESDDKIVIAKLPTENVSKLAYVTNVSLATESVDVEYLGTSFKFEEKSKYNTKVFKFYDTTKEMMYENSNICYERIVDYTDEYIGLANRVNYIIDNFETLDDEQINELREIESRISEIDSMVGYNILIF